MNPLKLLAVSAVSILFLSACATNQTVVEPKPTIVCDDCSGLVYYGPQGPAPENPFVSALKVVAGAGTQIAGYGYLADTAKNITSTTANAGRYAIVEQPDPTIVTQPAPTVITQPDPTIVNPVVVTQPDPVIVDPTVVNPVVIEP